MRILFVAMGDSPHTAGWLRLLDGTDWEVFVIFPYPSHPIDGLPTQRVSPWTKSAGGVVSILPGEAGHFVERVLQKTPARQWRAALLRTAVRRLRPDIVHSLEFQHCGYLCLEARRGLAEFPTWIATNWGSDIAHFGSLEGHRSSLIDLLGAIDVYGAECHRDVDLARELGCTADLFPVVPNNGGFELAAVQSLRDPRPPSLRKTVMVKGYQHFSGRAMVALDGVRRCRRALGGYRVLVYSATPDVSVAVDGLRHDHGIDIHCLPRVSQQEMMRLHGAARTSVSIGLTDGISISMLEAMTMGSYPIQSVGACADEWIRHRISGSLVEVDAEQIADELSYALQDDALVDGAAAKNADLAARRLDRASISGEVVRAYLGLRGLPRGAG